MSSGMKRRTRPEHSTCGWGHILHQHISHDLTPRDCESKRLGIASTAASMKALLIAAVLPIVAVALGAQSSVREPVQPQEKPPVQRKTCTSADGVTIVYSAAGAGDTSLLFIHGGFASSQARADRPDLIADRARYPAHWWAPVPKEGAPAWEILPQEAGPGEVIVSKRHELGLLSNFAATPFVFHGVRYASLEGFWQTMLYPEGPDDPRTKFPGLVWPHTRGQVSLMTGFEAKDAGTLAEQNMTRMSIDWVTFEAERFPYRPDRPGRHYDLIVAATREKVRQNPRVQQVLLATGDLILRPDHHEEAGARDAWRYCDILMQIRADLKGTR